MPRRRTSRIYWKDGKAYADFRDYAAWGGHLEALKVPGTRSATTDADEAMRICAGRLEELQAAKRANPSGTPETQADPLERIAPFAGYHLSRLEQRKKRGRMLTPRS